MSATSKVVRETARTALKGHWVNVSIACITVAFCYFICDYAVYFLSIPTNQTVATVAMCTLSFFLLLPLLLGLLRYVWRLIFGMHEHPIGIFYYFTEPVKYARALKLWVALLIRGLLFGVLLFLPALAVQILASATLYDLIHMPMPLWASNLGYVALLLKSVASVALFFIMLRYYMAPFLAFADENASTAEVIRLSITIARITAIDFLQLLLSFLGWALLSLLIVPAIFTAPYLLTSCCVHARFSIAQYNKLINTPSKPENIPIYAARF